MHLKKMLKTSKKPFIKAIKKQKQIEKYREYILDLNKFNLKTSLSVMILTLRKLNEVIEMSIFKTQ